MINVNPLHSTKENSIDFTTFNHSFWWFRQARKHTVSSFAQQTKLDTYISLASQDKSQVSPLTYTAKDNYRLLGNRLQQVPLSPWHTSGSSSSQSPRTWPGQSCTYERFLAPGDHLGSGPSRANR